MSLFCDGGDVGVWRIAWNAVGPFYVDSWGSSFMHPDGDPVQFHRVIGKHGHQCSTDDGCVIMCTREYAQSVCDAANDGLLTRQKEPRRIGR